MSTPKKSPRTQMVGEAPGDDLGYDPSTIPVEDIPEDSDEGDAEDQVRTQATAESPGDDLGYDPSIIPVEDIPED